MLAIVGDDVSRFINREEFGTRIADRHRVGLQNASLKLCLRHVETAPADEKAKVLQPYASELMLPGEIDMVVPK